MDPASEKQRRGIDHDDRQEASWLSPSDKTLRRELLSGCRGAYIRKTLSKAGTAPGAGRMRYRSGGIPKRDAHLLDSLVVEPALRNTLFYRPAVGADFAAANIVVSALMVKHEETYSVRFLVKQIRI
jgi:hypothetical protein